MTATRTARKAYGYGPIRPYKTTEALAFQVLTVGSKCCDQPSMPSPKPILPSRVIHFILVWSPIIVEELSVSAGSERASGITQRAGQGTQNTTAFVRA
jgi:hypothetical protein